MGSESGAFERGGTKRLHRAEKIENEALQCSW